MRMHKTRTPSSGPSRKKEVPDEEHKSRDNTNNLTKSHSQHVLMNVLRNVSTSINVTNFHNVTIMSNILKGYQM